MSEIKRVYVVGTGRVCGVYTTREKALAALSFFEEDDSILDVDEALVDAFPPEYTKRFCVVMRKNGEVIAARFEKAEDAYDFSDRVEEWDKDEVEAWFGDEAEEMVGDEREGWTFHIWTEDVVAAIAKARKMREELLLPESQDAEAGISGGDDD